MAEEHEVNQGECIGSIAYDHGFFWETLWKDPQNAELKVRRKDPNVLKEGDVVHIPDVTLKEESGATEQCHSFKLKGVPSKLRLRVLQDEEDLEKGEDPTEPDFASELSEWNDENRVDDQDESVEAVDQAPPPSRIARPRVNAPYLLWVDGAASRGETKSDGLIECSIPPNARKARLVLDPGTAKEVAFDLKLGHLDPVAETSGVQARLNNLGFNCGPVDGVLGPQTRWALKKFQASVGLDATGELDEATRHKLHEAHEST